MQTDCFIESVLEHSFQIHSSSKEKKKSNRTSPSSVCASVISYGYGHSKNIKISGYDIDSCNWPVTDVKKTETKLGRWNDLM